MKNPRSMRLRSSYHRFFYLLLICALVAAVSLIKTNQPASAETERSAVTQPAAIKARSLLRAMLGMAMQPLLVGTITVNSTSDAAANDGLCTLREAITAANTDTASGAAVGECAAGSGTDTINFDAVVFGAPGPYTINLTGVLPDLNSNLTINGPGASVLTVKRNTVAEYRIFTITATRVVNLSGLTINNGFVRGAAGGNIGQGGGISNSGTLTITACVISGNQAAGGSNVGLTGGDGRGGGIANFSSLTITNSTLKNNTANGGCGSCTNGGAGQGGAVFSSFATVIITDSTLNDNDAVGGFANTGGTGGDGRGGAIFTDGNTGTVTVRRSTLNSNDASGGDGFGGSDNGYSYGGGIATTNNSTLTVENSTISGNRALGVCGSCTSGNDAHGGGINNFGPTTVTDSTIVFNSATSAGLTSEDSGGGIAQGTGTFNISNTIVALNTDSAGIVIAPDVTGSFNSLGHNFIGDEGNSSGFTNGVGGDQVGPAGSPINPMIGALASNGGPTQTHALNAGSPAIDKGDSALTVDQRGATRPIDGDAVVGAVDDIGAYERGANGVGGVSFTVNSTADPGDGTCTLDNCTLEEAIIAANSNPGDDTINFDPFVFTASGATINLTGALPDLSSNITINGPGANVLTVRRNTGGNYRIFRITIGNTVAISGLTIKDGLALGTPGKGGGILNEGTLTVTNSTFTNNNATGANAATGGIGAGGAIYNDGGMTVTNCIFTSNAATGGNGTTDGGPGWGGAVYHNVGALTFANNTLSGNSATGGTGTTGNGGPAHGGAIYNFGGTTKYTNNTISQNSANGGNGNGGGSGRGGAIYTGAGSPVFTNNTLNQNSANGGDATLVVGDGTGGAVFIDGGTPAFTNNTLSQNTAAGGDSTGPVGGNGQGGGVYNSSGTSTFRNNTLTLNSASAGGGSLFAGTANGGGIFFSGGTINIGNTIVAQNTALSTGPDVSGTFASQGHNLIGNGDGSNFINGSNGDQVGATGTEIHPRLAPLANNGGPTLTHALLAISTAINAGDDALIPADVTDQDGDSNLAEPVPFDQRGTGFPRKVGVVDIGAFERQADDTQSGLAAFLVNTTADSNGACTVAECSLREAITLANSQVGAETISFDPVVFAAPGPYTINLTGVLPNLNSSMTINGPGANVLTVKRNTGGEYRIFEINGGNTVEIKGMTISNGLARGGISGGSGINSFGGGIGNGGNLTVANCIISGNSAIGGNGTTGSGGPGTGGGIYSEGTLIVTDSTISGNSAIGGNSASASAGAGQGGGIHIAAGTMTITNSTISGNTATGGNGSIGGDGNGGGIYHINGTETVTNCTITLNTAIGGAGPASGNGIGGGIFRSSGTFNIGNTIVAGNTALVSPDVNGTFTSQGHNLIGNNLGAAASFPAGVNPNGDIVGSNATPVNARLAALANNGGPTPTHALLAGSPALDAGDNSLAVGLTFDQRGNGFPRLRDAADADTTQTVDIGALEADPTVEDIPDKVSAEDTPLSFVFNVGDAATPFDSITATSSNTGLVPNLPANLSVTGSGSTRNLNILPAANQSGVTTITVTVTKTINGTVLSMTDTFVLTVAAVNDPPDAVDDAASVAKDSGANAINVLANDTSAPEVGETLTITAKTDGAHGAVAITGGGTGLTYTPNAGYIGPDSFTYTISDGNGGFDTATVTITVTGSIINFNSPTYSVGEGDGHATITVTRTTGVASAASFQYVTSDLSGLTNCDVMTGNASQRCDYTAIAGFVNFSAGQTSATFDIPIIDDVYVEGPETLTINFTGIVGSAPSPATLTINDNDLAPGAPNPIDGADFFIRMQYLDILNREPDPPGFAGWKAFLTNCPAGSTACDRVELSSRFFRSAEFFDRAYFVYRFYDTALGRKPTYDEYQRDLRLVAGFLNSAELEAMKAAFAEEFSQRPEFKAKYDSKANGDDYVNAIVATAGVVPSNRTSVAIRQGALVITRGQALRELVESPEISARFFNEAFVVIGYFAYLRREPDAQYLVWLNTLNTTGNYREMIRGFIESQEYRRRFGPN